MARLSNKVDGNVFIHDAKTEDEIRRCYPVMAQLRPQYGEQEFVDRVKRQQKQGYRLICLMDDGVVRAAAGVRPFDALFSDRAWYVDDLITDETSRSRGYGEKLLTWIQQQARAAGCTQLHLDSGTHRMDAHRFYFRQKMTITSFHFVKNL